MGRAPEPKCEAGKSNNQTGFVAGLWRVSDMNPNDSVSQIREFCTKNSLNQGWGLLSQFPPFRYFPKFSALSKHTLTIKYNVHIWQVSPQLSCGDTCQIWTWFEVSNLLFWEIEICRNEEINRRSFSNPHPCSLNGYKNFSFYIIISHWS